jgi:short subunit dehydrogenase-like uncharacterized protein
MITLFGATGYTGQLIARTLAEQGLPFRLAGRSAARLAALAATLPGPPATLVADVAAPATLPALAEGTRVLINCAGPFTDIGEAVAALAARRGLRYLDTTNELAYIHAIYTRLGPLAQASGATLVPACAFEVALADCAAALLARAIPSRPLEELSVTYMLPGAGSSRGTRASALRSLATSWLAYRDGAYLAERPCTTVRSTRIGGRIYRTLAFPSGETATVPAHLPVREVSTWMVVSRAAAIYGPRVMPLVAPLLRGPLGHGLRRLALRAAPPAPEARARMPFTIVVAARAGVVTSTITLRGVDPYGLTARIAGFAAARLLGADTPAGVLPPALALDPAELIEAVRDWGVEVS